MDHVGVDASTGLATYTPQPGYVGLDAFTYVVRDALGLASNVATVDVTVFNLAPVANDDLYPRYGGHFNHELDVLANDLDADGVIDISTIEIVTQPSAGVISDISPEGKITYTSDGSDQQDSFTYMVRDDVWRGFKCRNRPVALQPEAGRERDQRDNSVGAVYLCRYHGDNERSGRNDPSRLGAVQLD